MSEFLEFRLDTEVAGDLEAYIGAKAQALEAALVAKVDLLNLILQQRIVGEKLQGQVVNARTGNLARSVEAIPAVVSPGLIEGRVQVGGGVAFYARYLEEGVRGGREIVPTNAKALAFVIGGKQIFVKKVIQGAIAPRNFVRSTFEESRDEIIAGLNETLGEVKG